MNLRTASLLVIALLSAVWLGACGGKKSSLAELTKADGPVEKQIGDGAWGAAAVGTQFNLGDAVRTADGGAQLKLSGGATIAMQPHTILRFGGGKGGASKIAVELGAIDLSGTGQYQFDVGDVSLAKNGTVRITAKGKGQATFELTLGAATMSKNGQTIDLTIGQAVDLGMDLTLTPGDAGVADAAPPPVDAVPPDAAPANEDVTMEITGKKAEMQAGSGTDPWTPVPAGTAVMPKGARLRLGAGTTAKLVAKGTTLELGGGSRVSVSVTSIFALELGTAKASVPINGAGEVDVPGGSVTLKGDANGPGEARLETNGKESKVSVSRGSAKLSGPAGGAMLDMSRGESASFDRQTGSIHPQEAIPTYFDFRVTVGDTLTVHDPKPPTAVQFQFGGKCPTGGVIELDRDTRFRTAHISAGKDSANIMVNGGGWAYRLRCSQGDNEGPPVASGRIAVTRDDGHRALPKTEAKDQLEADGRNYRVSYQSLIPTMEIKFRGPGSQFRLHLAQGGKEQTFDSSKSTIAVPGKSLHEGSYTYWFDHDGVKQPKVSQLTIDFDQSAAQVYIESPQNGVAWTGQIDVRGAALAGWSASVEGVPLPVDRSQRFSAKVDPPPGNALAIRLAHPQRGVHYYLRRQK